MNESELAAEILLVFQQVHGDMPFILRFADEIANLPNCSIHGECDFSSSPPTISIRTGLGETDFIDTFCHELAHLACGLKSGHDETWAQARDELSTSFWARYIHECDC
ncbi:MAG: hypothetical protein ACM3X0_07710 [Bacteroidota bacterium]